MGLKVSGETLKGWADRGLVAPVGRPAPAGGGVSKGRRTAEAVADWCRAGGLPAPVAEHQFARPRRWRFDLAWPDRLLAVEFQGGVWTGGRHTRGKGFQADCEKFSTAAAMGWRVMPVTYGQVADGSLHGWLLTALGPPRRDDQD